MNTSGRQLVHWVTASIKSLSLNPDYGSLNSVYEELARHSGLSKSMIIKLYSGESANPQVETLDKLISAIKQAHMRMAS